MSMLTHTERGTLLCDCESEAAQLDNNNVAYSFNRWWLLLIGIGLAAILLLALPASQMPEVDAWSLVNKTPDGSAFLVDADHVGYTRATVYRRANPDQQEPADPYHSPVLPLSSDTFLSETWARGGNTGQTRATFRDKESGRLISMMIDTGESVFLFDETTENGMWIPSSGAAGADGQRGPSSEVPLAAGEREGYAVTDEVISAWGRPAWVVQYRFDPASMEAGRPGPNFPSDLDIQALETRWVVDKETGQFVRTEQWANTPAGSVLLERVETEPLEILPLDSLPATWLEAPEDVPQATLPALVAPTIRSAN